MYNDCSFGDNEKESQFVMGVFTVILAGGYYSFDKGDDGGGVLFSSVGGLGLFWPLTCKLSFKEHEKKNTRIKRFILNSAGIATAWSAGLYAAASPDPDDILSGALITAGIMIFDVVLNSLLFR